MLRRRDRACTTPSCARATARRATTTTTASSATRSLAVIGMGKLGGEELNFSSDVDVIYVYSSDQGEAGTLSLHEYFAKLCTEVTARARPRSPRTISCSASICGCAPRAPRARSRTRSRRLERYYETFGRPWERQAWIKARLSAGDRALGARDARRRCSRSCSRAIASPAVVDDVRDLNRRIKRELVRRGKRRLRRQERRRRHPRDRVLRAGAAADPRRQAAGAAPARHARARSTRCCSPASSPTTSTTRSARAYRWLRHAEHVLQLEAGLQTQTMPDDPRAPRAVRAPARLRRRGDVRRPSSRATRSAVARLFATLGDGRRRSSPTIAAILRGELSPTKQRPRRSRGSASSTSPPRAPSSRARAAAPARRCRRPRPSARRAIGAQLLAEIAALGRSRSGAARARRSDRAARRGVVDLARCSTSSPRSRACSARSSARARTSRARSSTRPS